MDSSNCNGSTRRRLRLFISASCLARDSSRCCTTSLSACSAASRMSTGPPCSAALSVMLSATSAVSQTRCAGRQSSCRSVCHRKSSSSRSVLPGNRRVPRPTIWLYRLRTLVGRSTTTQLTLGQSQPSVSSILLHSTLYSPRSNAARISARSGDSPFTSAARKPREHRISRNFWLVLTSGRNTTVLRSAQVFAISSAIW